MTVARYRKRAQVGLNQNLVSGLLVERAPLEGGSEEHLCSFGERFPGLPVGGS